MRDHRGAALATAHIDGKTSLALVVPDELIADVMHLDRRAVLRRAGEGELELARQIGEFRVD